MLALTTSRAIAAWHGHDFWLSRNGHGVGFWDLTELGEVGNALSRACTKFQNINLYVGDDGKVYA